MRSFLVLVLWISFAHLGYGQTFPNFKDESASLKGNHQTRGFLPSAFTDVNGDLVDDLIIFDRGLSLKLLAGNPYLKLLFAEDSLIFPHYFDAFSIAMGDFNLDNQADIAIGGSMGYVRVYLSSPNGYVTKDLPANFLVQTMNIIDVNMDGQNDLFICNDSGANIFYLNSGQGNFQKNTTTIDFSTMPASDMSGNYGSVWLDVNNDLRPDLALAKCRAGVADPADPRRINALYINQGDSGFKNEAKNWGFDLGQQSWAVTFGDYDNDGDFDAFVVNHYDPHVLLENIDGQRFDKKQYSENEFSSFAFQAVSRDFDNDGWLDIVMAGLNGITFLHNKQGLSFEILNGVPLALRGMSMSVGDVNDDGFYDIHAQLNESLNIPSQVDDRLYINQGNLNHFLKISVLPDQNEMVLSGTRIDLFGPWGTQSRQYVGGESFGITTSSQFHFGMGASQMADSLRVYWPSGRVETFYGLQANKTYTLGTGNCLREKIRLADSTPVIDSIQGVEINAPDGFITYRWNNNLTSQSITVNQEGQHFVVMEDSLGCLTYSDPVYVSFGCFPPFSNPLGDASHLEFCSLELKELQTIEAVAYQWNTGDTTQTLMVEFPGTYQVTVTDNCQNQLVDSLEIGIAQAPLFNIMYPDSVHQNTRSFCVSSGENTEWLTCDGNQIVNIGDTFYFDMKWQDTCFIARGFEEYRKYFQITGNRQFPALNQFGSGTLNGAILFDVHTPMVLQSVDVYTDTPGKRKFIVLDNQGQIIREREVFISFGFNTVTLAFFLDPGKKFTLMTDKDVNLAQLGTDSPRFIRHSGGNIQFPYSIDQVLDITSSNFGTNNYYYFYNWKVEYDTRFCYQDDVEILVKAIKTSSSYNQIADIRRNLKVSPNPSHEYFTLTLANADLPGLVTIYSWNGELVGQIQLRNSMELIPTDNLLPGLYTLTFANSETTYYGKFIKQ